PLKRFASDAFPSSVSNRYSLSIRTHGSACRRRAISSLRRVRSFSALSSSSRASSHSFLEATLWSCVNVLLSFPFITFSFLCLFLFSDSFYDPNIVHRQR